MPKNTFILTKDALEGIPDEKFCCISSQDTELLKQTPEEVGRLCKDDLGKILKLARRLTFDVACSVEYDAFFLVKEERVSPPFYMDPRETDAIIRMMEFLTDLYRDGEEVVVLLMMAIGNRATTQMSEHLYYLWQLRKKLPLFEEANIEVTIDTEERCAYCKRLDIWKAKTLRYPITQKGYYQAISFLHSTRKRKNLPQITHPYQRKTQQSTAKP